MHFKTTNIILLIVCLLLTRHAIAEDWSGGGYDANAARLAEQQKYEAEQYAKNKANKLAKAKKDKLRKEQKQRQKAAAIAKEKEEKRLSLLPENMAKVYTPQACLNAGKEYKQDKTKLWIDELKRRQVRFNEQDIINSTIRIGGFDCDVFAAYGRPNRINRTVNAHGVSLQIVYDRSYIYTDNGVITSWSD